jgi:hypothetical protein
LFPFYLYFEEEMLFIFSWFFLWKKYSPGFWFYVFYANLIISGCLTLQLVT